MYYYIPLFIYYLLGFFYFIYKEISYKTNFLPIQIYRDTNLQINKNELFDRLISDDM